MKYIHSYNPSRNFEKIGKVKMSSKAEIIGAVAKSREAFTEWSKMSLSKRCKAINSFLTISKQRSEEIAEIIAKETGRPLKSSHLNVKGGIYYFEEYIKMSPGFLRSIKTFESGSEKHLIVREPRGVIAAILPWNYPFMNVSWQCGQALISGNTIIYKNSEENPLFAKLLKEIVDKSAIPKGVLNILIGDSSVGEFLVNQDIDMISFTGSTEVGQYLANIASKKFIPITLELGGSSPMIIFDDVKIDEKLISYICERRFKNTGQACDAVKRLIVHKSLFKKVVDGIVQFVKKYRIGDALDMDTEIGPLISLKQLEKLRMQVKDSVSKGGNILIGGKKHPKLSGSYYLPTIITQIKTNMKVWTEETFGPVLPIISFNSEKEAIQLANDTEYGLTAHIFTNNKDKFLRVASQIEAGSIAHNYTGFWSPKNPFGGYKHSGMGRTHGLYGFLEYTQPKVLSIQN